MKVVICGSMSHSKRMVEIKEELIASGHKAIIPENTEEYAKKEDLTKEITESAREKIDDDLIKGYFEEIKNCDAVLIANEEKNNIPNYIGGNAFLELAFGYVLNKKIFLLNGIPKISYQDEIVAMQPILLKGRLEDVR